MNKELLIHNAEEKLKREMKSENPNIPVTMIQKKVAAALKEFFMQEPKIAEEIINSKKTFDKCCENILRDTKQQRYISDLEAYKRAVEFYIPGADIKFSMSVILPGNSAANISLADLLKL